MLFAIDKVNEDNDLLANISLKARIFDTCANPSSTASHTRTLVKMKILKATGASPLAGVVGAAISDVSAKVANILQVFEIPQISYASTSVLLSDKDDYSYFLRTVAPDSFQVQVMVDICLKLNWTYVMTVNSEGIYGTKGIEGFIELAQEKGICTDHIASIKPVSSKGVYEDIVNTMVERSEGNGVSAVVLFCTGTDGYGITRAAQKNKDASRFIWITSDAWGMGTRDLTKTSVIAIQMMKSNVSEDFENYFKSLNVNKPRWKNDVHLREFWQHIFKCALTNTSVLPKCTGNEDLKNASIQIMPWHTVSNAVYAFAHALHSHQKELCLKQTGMCGAMSFFEGKHLLEHLMNVSFTDSLNSKMKFNANGEVDAMYAIMNFQENNSEKKYVHVGTWKSGRDKNDGQENLDLKLQSLKWHSVNSDSPVSYCSRNCPFGSVKEPRPGYNVTCCWSCHVCDELQIIVNDTCLDGPVGYIPSANRTMWVKREVVYLKWDDKISTVLITISVLSITLTLFTLFVFTVFYNNPTVKASGREVSNIILAGILLCFVNPFLYIAKPTDAICYARKSSVGLALAIIYSALFMKLNRVYRIFKSAESSVRRPAFVRPKPQILVTIGLISIHVLFITLWFVIEPTHATETYDSEKEELLLECKTKAVNFVGSHSYVIVLMILCTIYAFKTRRFPKNFNESKHIGFTLYTTCVVSTLFVAFFLNTKKKLVEDMLIACTSIAWGLITLLGLFAQRVYIILSANVAGMEPRLNLTPVQSVAQSMERDALQINVKRTAKVCAESNVKKVKVTKGYKKRSVTF